MELYIALILLLFLFCIVLLWRLASIRKNLRDMREELEKTRAQDYNRQLRVALSDSEVTGLAAELNRNLDHQKELKLKEERSRRSLEQSVSDIAHDLRTPLTVIKGNLQMLEKEELSERGREYLEQSRKKAVALKDMVDEFFELSVMESDPAAVELQRIDAVAFMTDFVIGNEVLIREKGLEPELQFPDHAVCVMADPDMLQRVCGNLMSNIFKYAQDSFEIRIREESDGRCVIRMGNRIPDSADRPEVERLFERTYRADKARAAGGAGLGLYIARQLAEKQRGRLEAVQEGEWLYFLLSFELQPGL